jgi:septum formation protein
MAADVDETIAPGETPEAHVRRLAEAKARAILSRVPGRPVLAADTIVVVDDQILGKPVDAEDAARMLRLLSARPHEVMTAVCLAWSSSAAGASDAEAALSLETQIEATMVEFSRLSDAEIVWYVSTGEPVDKAGAYAVQGLASRFVTRINGSYTNVVGLPVALTCAMLKTAGLRLT